MSTAAGLVLLSLITQIEAAGHTRVLMLDDCPDGLKGLYTPTHNRIGLCRQGHSSDGLQRCCQCKVVGLAILGIGRTELLVSPVIAWVLAHLLQGIGDRWRS